MGTIKWVVDGQHGLSEMKGLFPRWMTTIMMDHQEGIGTFPSPQFNPQTDQTATWMFSSSQAQY